MDTVFEFTADVKLDLRDIPDNVFRAELNNRREILADVQSELEEDIREGATLSDFDTEDLVNELAQRRLSDRDWVEDVYRHLADGDCAGAMDIMHRDLGLAPPSHACALADLLAGRKGTSHV